MQRRIFSYGPHIRFALLCLVIVPISSRIDIAAQSKNTEVAGIIRDESGAAVSGAQVEFREKSRVQKTMTSPDGAFRLNSQSGAGILTVTASGFAALTLQLTTGTPNSHLHVLLKPASIREQVNITATRTETPLGSTAASVRVLSSKELSTTAAFTIDDALRQVPGFQLFRRSGSRTANPTSQGVSLRGVGASGASRALVLFDGIPLNDPFGGWVYWDRAPREVIDRVEVVRGAASDLYGSG